MVCLFLFKENGNKVRIFPSGRSGEKFRKEKQGNSPSVKVSMITLFSCFFVLFFVLLDLFFGFFFHGEMKISGGRRKNENVRMRKTWKTFFRLLESAV